MIQYVKTPLYEAFIGHFIPYWFQKEKTVKKNITPSIELINNILFLIIFHIAESNPSEQVNVNKIIEVDNPPKKTL